MADKKNEPWDDYPKIEQKASPRQEFARRQIESIEAQIKKTTDPKELANLRLHLKDAQARLAKLNSERDNHGHK